MKTLKTLSGDVSRAEVTLDHSRDICPSYVGEYVDKLLNNKVIVEKYKESLFLDDKEVLLRYCDRNVNGKRLKGFELYTTEKKSPILDPYLLEFLLENKDFIPKKWEDPYRDLGGCVIFFWGTAHLDTGGGLNIKALCFKKGSWIEANLHVSMILLWSEAVPT